MTSRPDEPLYSLPTFSRSAQRRLRALALLGLVAAVVLAMSAATQFLAWRWSFHPALGEPWLDEPLRLYSPSRLLEWSSRFGEEPATARDVETAVHLFGAGLLGLLLPSLFVLRGHLSKLRHEGDTHGSAHWARPEEVHATGLLVPPPRPGERPAVVVGAWSDGTGVHYLRDTRDLHVLAYAPSGAGKSTCLIVPTLLEWRDSVVVLDPKSELWNLTAGHRREALGNRCLRFDPACVDGSAARYNPLLAIPRSREDVKYAQSLADILVDPDGTGKARDFWQQSAHALLVGVALHVLWARPDKTLAGCASLLSDPERSIEDSLTEMLGAAHDPALAMGWRTPSGELTATHPVVASCARKMLDLDKRTSSGVLATAQSHLELFRDPIVADNTAVSDFSARDLMHHEAPVSLYLAIAPAELVRLRGLIRIVLQQITRQLTESMEFHFASNEPRFRHRLLLLLDEFTILGRLDFIASAIAFVRGYGIRVYISIQSITQLLATYGQHQSISTNCGIQTALSTNDLATAEVLSKLTGTMTVNWERRSTSAGAPLASVGAGRTNYSQTEVGRPLLTPDEVRRLPAKEALVFVGGHPPIRGVRRPYFEDPGFSASVRIPPPAVSDRLGSTAPDWPVARSIEGSTETAAQIEAARRVAEESRHTHNLRQRSLDI